MSQDIVMQLLLTVATAGGVYAGVKADLTRAIMLAEQAAQAAKAAHDRLDKHMENRTHGGQ